MIKSHFPNFTNTSDIANDFHQYHCLLLNPPQQRKLRRLLLLHSNRLIVLIPMACQYKFGMVSTFKWLDLGTSPIRPIVGPCDSKIWHLQSEMPPKENIVWDGNGPKAFPKMFYPWKKLHQIPFRLLSFILILRRLHLFSKHFPLVHWSNQNLPKRCAAGSSSMTLYDQESNQSLDSGVRLPISFQFNRNI